MGILVPSFNLCHFAKSAGGQTGGACFAELTTAFLPFTIVVFPFLFLIIYDFDFFYLSHIQ